MRRIVLFLALAALVTSATAVALVRGPSPKAGTASSHREAPAIAEDPSADPTDLYAFRSVDAPDKLTIIANWLPAEDPAAGPNWYRFSNRARYNIKIDRSGDGVADLTYRFLFKNRRGLFFLGNTVQDYTVTRIRNGRAQMIGRGITPPNNIGPRTNSNLYGSADYRSLAAAQVRNIGGGLRVFAGQREDAFFGDIGAIFDLVAFRSGTGNAGGGKDFFAGYGVHAVALQVPITQLDDSDHTVGVWMTTERRKVTVRDGRARSQWVQVARLGNPLVNEVIIPTRLKDRWNRTVPANDQQYVRYFRKPILAAVMNQLYPGVVNAPEDNRDDLVQVLLTGVPGLNETGTQLADMLRVNLSIAPTASPNRLGVFGADNAGWPNGRRLGDDVIDIAVRAVAGKLKANPNADLLGDGVDANDVAHMSFFPYEADPFSGFDNTKGEQKP